MAEFKYQEPLYLALGEAVYSHFVAQQSKGNVVSILSDAMLTLRQLGTIGLALWIDSNKGERKFIRSALQGEIAEQLALSKCLAPEQRDIETVWSDTERLVKVLRYAKYYAKTKEKND
ncbi:MAG: hypothetical protein Q3M24_13365 [Candidatus Electrothrix aestuarii]|uniref:CRISPR type III-B/RAMP module-associated protein Cmr5 n=1 Tax=Candidatus Electrothrix aestuarii TaxID=3062594 RepID=A0AAU8LQJ7_9BACT|nr:hypothetical protein [Candidatus Electrothrix aestuarii]WPD24669.1 MAG: hypothetical protein SD837_08920 [Candidatus Electrothrix sp. GW3-3]